MLIDEETLLLENALKINKKNIHYDLFYFHTSTKQQFYILEGNILSPLDPIYLLVIS